MKKYILLLAIVFALSTAGTAMATGPKKCPPGQEKKDWKCVDIVKPGGGSSASIGDITNSNKNTNTNLNLNDNTNTNVNKNDNTNINVNSNKATSNAKSTAVAIQGQDQKQGQVQGQDQGQGQAQSVDNTIVIEDNSVIIHPEIPVTYNHITPSIGKTSADMVNDKNALRIKTMGSVDGFINSIARVHAKKLAEGASDLEIVESLLFENDFRTTMISKGAVGQFMGQIYLIPDGDDVTMAGMEGQAYLAAMDAGATHYVLTHDVGGLYMEGSKAGIDFGGSASVAIAKDGSAVVAPGGTLGFSTAWSSNEYRPGVMITLYFDHTLTITPAK